MGMGHLRDRVLWLSWACSLNWPFQTMADARARKQEERHNSIECGIRSTPSPVPFPHDTASAPRPQLKTTLVNSHFFAASAQSSIAIDSPRLFPLPLVAMKSWLGLWVRFIAQRRRAFLS